jgi:hypothetical protein
MRGGRQAAPFVVSEAVFQLYLRARNLLNFTKVPFRSVSEARSVRIECLLAICLRKVDAQRGNECLGPDIQLTAHKFSIGKMQGGVTFSVDLSTGEMNH